LSVNDTSATIRLASVPAIDSYTFFNPQPPTLPGVPSVTSFRQTYTKSGSPRTVQPTSADPTSAFDWAGKMWKATASIEFSVAYLDGSFSAHGSGTSAATDFGEMGSERNGSFLSHGDG
jgi:hypothetical protein